MVPSPDIKELIFRQASKATQEVLVFLEREKQKKNSMNKFFTYSYMREEFPYGKWECKKGREILFNRNYCCIWEKNKFSIQEPKRCNKEEWASDILSQEYFFNDSCPPWENEETAKRCISVLANFGVDIM